MKNMFRPIVSTVTLVAFLSTILILPATPLLAQEPATTENTANACFEAQQDVETLHSSGIYAFGGFMCGIFGFVFAAVSSPKPPAERLVGKSSEYVATYSQCYESKAKSKNTKSACVGWAVGAAVAVAIIVATDSGE